MRHTSDQRYKLTTHQHQIAIGLAGMYNDYKTMVKIEADLSAVPQSEIHSTDISDTTAVKAERIEPYMNKIRLIEKTARDAGDDLWKFILLGVTEERSYDNLRLMYGIPCGKDEYYRRRQYFLWLLYKRFEMSALEPLN